MFVYAKVGAIRSILTILFNVKRFKCDFFSYNANFAQHTLVLCDKSYTEKFQINQGPHFDNIIQIQRFTKTVCLMSKGSF